MPVLSLTLPLQSETHWSDMLAVLIATDPVPLSSLIKRHYDPATLTVTREASVDDADRPDIVLTAAGTRVAVIEVKVLAGLGPRQLERYYEAVPGADIYVLVYLEHLPVPLHDAGPWRELTWEAVLQAYEGSADPWVAATAHAWCHHLDGALPKVGPETRWNDLHEGADFVIAMRARMSWLYSNPAQPRAVHDREGYKRMVAAGAPPFLGIGFGEANAKINHACMFGARIQFPADSTLADISREIAEIAELTLKLARES